MKSAISGSGFAPGLPCQARLSIPSPPAVRRPTAVAMRRVFMLLHGAARPIRTFLTKCGVIDTNAAGVVMGAFKVVTALYYPRHMLDLISATLPLGKQRVRPSALLFSTKILNYPIPGNPEAELDNPQLECVRGTSPQQVPAFCPLRIYSPILTLDCRRTLATRYLPPRQK